MSTRVSARAVIVPVAFLALLGASIASLSGEWRGFFSHEAVERMASFFASFFPPDLKPSFLAKVAKGAAETIAVSLLGTLLAAIFGLLLALPASGAPRSPARVVARLAQNALRAVPELVWAALIVIAAGLGPFAGVLALGVHTTGVLGRLFAETLENSPPDAAASLRANGATRASAFWYGTLPQVLPQLVSYALYRWENNIRAASILGIVGAGGLGQMLYFHLSLFQLREASTVLIAIVTLVALVDGASHALRGRLAG